MRSTAGATSGSHRVLLDRPNVRPSGACGPCGAGGRESPAHAASASGSGNHASSCDAGCSAGMSSSRSFLPRVRVGGAMAERVGFEPTDRVNGPEVLVRPPGLVRWLAERVGFEPTDRVNGHRGSRETARSRPMVGGEGGIRTHGPLARSTVFETAPFDHSGTSPRSSPLRRVPPSPAPEWRRGWDSNPR